MALISYKKFQSTVAHHKGDYKARSSPAGTSFYILHSHNSPSGNLSATRCFASTPITPSAIILAWIKQHLKEKSLFGQSENAVKVQLWSALAVYAVVAIVKKRFSVAHSLYEMLQVTSLSALEKVPIAEFFDYNYLHKSSDQQYNQLKMF